MKRPFLRYHGGKFRIADWVISHFPEHRKYVEPYGGGASVLLAKPRAFEEVYSDRDKDIFNLFCIVRDDVKKLQSLLRWTLWSRDEFNLAFEDCDDPIEKARRTLVRSFMGFGSAGATKQATGFRYATRDNGLGDAVRWREYPKVLEEVHDRLIGVIIENKKAEELIDLHDDKETLFYFDPPYLPETRQMSMSKKYYRHEMTTEEHIALLEKILHVKGMVIISGYESDLYDDILVGWEKQSINARAAGFRGAVKRKECVWINPNAQSKLQQSLFYTA